jgi:D-amino peptidase
MKIYISADMEGATGVTDVVQTMETRPEYAFGCRMMAHDVRAAIEGALKAGADEILVNDAHGRKINIDIGQLGGSGAVRLLSGTPKPLGMMEGCDSSCDGVFFIGYHAMAGTPFAVLDHTVSGRTVFSVELNGREVGETGLNAAVAAGFGVPVAMAEGDDALEKEVHALLGPDVVYACVKKARARLAADSMLPALSAGQPRVEGPAGSSYEYISRKAQEAVALIRSGRAPKMDIGDGSFDLKITFHTTAQCDAACQIPVLKRIGGRTVELQGRGMAEMRRWSGAIISLAGTAN